MLLLGAAQARSLARRPRLSRDLSGDLLGAQAAVAEVFCAPSPQLTMWLVFPPTLIGGCVLYSACLDAVEVDLKFTP